MPAPNFSRPEPVLIIDYKCENRRPSLPPPDKALQELMASRVTCGSNSSSGCQLGTPPSSWSVGLVDTAVAAGSETQAWFSSGTLSLRAPTFPRSPARAVPRGGCVLPQSPPLDGGMLMMPSLTYQRPSLRGLGRFASSMFDGYTPLTTGARG